MRGLVRAERLVLSGRGDGTEAMVDSWDGEGYLYLRREEWGLLGGFGELGMRRLAMQTLLKLVWLVSISLVSVQLRFPIGSS